MRTIKDFVVNNLLGWFLKIDGILLLIVVLMQIFSRMIPSIILPWTDEVARLLFIWFAFIGAAYGYNSGAHIGVDILYNKVKNKTLLDIIIIVLELVFCVIVVIYGIKMLGITHSQKSPILRIPMSVFYAVLPTTGFVMLLITMTRIGDIIKTLFGERR